MGTFFVDVFFGSALVSGVDLPLDVEGCQSSSLLLTPPLDDEGSWFLWTSLLLVTVPLGS